MSYGKVEYDEILDAFKCEICNKFFSGLSHHVYKMHNVRLADYRKQFGFNKTTPLTTLKEREQHRERARELGIFRELNKNNPHSFKKGDNSRQKYRRSLETLRWLKGELAPEGRKKMREIRYAKKLTKQTQ